MPTDPGAPAARKALKYVPGTHPGGGLPAADVTDEQAATWYTQAQVDEAIASGSHELANKQETKVIAEAAQADAAPKESE